MCENNEQMIRYMNEVKDNQLMTDNIINFLNNKFEMNVEKAPKIRVLVRKRPLNKK